VGVKREIDADLKKHPAVQRVVEQGYRIEYSFREGPPFLDLDAWHGRRRVGWTTACFNKGEMYLETIHTVEDLQHRGIATALMICAVQLTACKPRKAANQTEDGRALWAQPNRPW
jgi:hypothetical protein